MGGNVYQVWLFVIGLYAIFALFFIGVIATIGYIIIVAIPQAQQEWHNIKSSGRKCKGPGSLPKYAVLYFNRQYLKDGRYDNIDYIRVWFDIEGSASQEDVLRSITEYFEEKKEVISNG